MKQFQKTLALTPALSPRRGWQFAICDLRFTRAEAWANVNRKSYIVNLLLCLGLCALPLRASTISDTILNAQGIGYAAKVSFFPLSNPQTSGGTTLTSRQIDVTCATNGAFSVVLRQ